LHQVFNVEQISAVCNNCNKKITVIPFIFELDIIVRDL